jgi:hypothetical protein
LNLKILLFRGWKSEIETRIKAESNQEKENRREELAERGSSRRME